MNIKRLFQVSIYLTFHLIASGSMNFLLFLNNTRDFFDIPIALIIGTFYKVLISFVFLKSQRIDKWLILPIITLAFITRLIFHGPFPIAIIAGWFFIINRQRLVKTS